MLVLLITGKASIAVTVDLHKQIFLTSKGKGYTIGFSNFSMENSWRVQMVAEFEFGVKKLQSEGIIDKGIKVISFDNYVNSDKLTLK